MLSRVLALHPKLGAFHEPTPLLNTEAYLRWSGKRDGHWIARRLATKRDRFIREVQANGLLYVESSHFLSHLIPDLLERYDARFVHLHRDGRQFVRSGLDRPWYGPRSFKALLEDRVRRSTGLNIGNSYRDHRLSPPSGLKTRFEAISWLWTEINAQILRHLDGVPDERRFAARLEDIGPALLCRLLKFLRQDSDPAILERMCSLAAERPNRTREHSTPPQDAWDANSRQRFSQIAGDMMSKLGYALD